ncbi:MULTISPECIES: hypothetical protein [unclassified Nonomuraea]|uniref:hypothetical protein n=1 Tax=unclassified Nonomuraea TaxID=2593643 RepID=UPI0033C0AABE
MIGDGGVPDGAALVALRLGLGSRHADDGQRGVVDPRPAVVGETAREQLSEPYVPFELRGMSAPARDGEGQEDLQAGEAA